MFLYMLQLLKHKQKHVKLNFHEPFLVQPLLLFTQEKSFYQQQSAVALVPFHPRSSNSQSTQDSLFARSIPPPVSFPKVCINKVINFFCSSNSTKINTKRATPSGVHHKPQSELSQKAQNLSFSQAPSHQLSARARPRAFSPALKLRAFALCFGKCVENRLGKAKKRALSLSRAKP